MSATTSIDDQLNRLDEDIRKLKVEFEIYFNGGAKKPPYDMKYRTDTLVKRLYDARGMTFGQRFKYNSLVARYNVYDLDARGLGRAEVRRWDATAERFVASPL